MPRVFSLRHLLLLLLQFFCQREGSRVSGQTPAEPAFVNLGGLWGGGSGLPYSGTRRSAGGSGASSGTNSSTGTSSQGPVFVGAHYLKTSRIGLFGGYPFPSTGGVPSSSGGRSYLGDGGGGRLMDPPNRSSLWREGVPGAKVNRFDNQLNCGAQYMPIVNLDGDEQSCGVCGDSPIGPQNHVIGGYYVSSFTPIVSRQYTSGSVLPVRFFLNHTIIPTLDKVTFSICPVNRQWGDISWDCVGEGGDVQIEGWGRAYLPSSPGEHRVHLRLPAFFACQRCVLQWRWQSTHLASTTQCNHRPLLRACYQPVEYINCADIRITRPPMYSLAYYLMMASTNT